jgi:hypothetical protein
MSARKDCSESLCAGPEGGNCTWGISAKQQAIAGGLTLATAKRQLESTKNLRGLCVNPDQLEEGISALEQKVQDLIP